MQAISKVLNVIRGVFGLGAQVKGVGKQAQGASAGIPLAGRLLLELVLVAVFVGFFTWIGFVLDLDRYLGARPGLRKYWLGLLVLLAYLIFRLTVFLVRQFRSTGRIYPDIDDALDRVMMQLETQGVELADVPLHLVVGLTRSQERQFAELPNVGRLVRVDQDNLAVHCYGDEEGLWLTLPQVSALAAQNQRLEPVWTSPAMFARQGDGQSLNTISIGRMTGDPAGQVKLDPEAVADLHLGGDELDHSRARTAYLVRLLTTLRRPFCPVNSVAALVPWPTLNQPAAVDPVVEAVRADLATLQAELPVKCLMVVGLTEIEHDPALATYARRLDPARRRRRCGCGYPKFVSFDDADADGLHRWLLQNFEHQCLDLVGNALTDSAGNGQMVRLLEEVRTAKPALARVLQAAQPRRAEPLYLGGVYFLGLDAGENETRPFCEGFWAKIVQGHDELIGWKDAALRHNRRNYRLAGILVTLASILFSGTGVLLFTDWLL